MPLVSILSTIAQSPDIRSALGRVTVSRAFYEAVKENFPALDEHPEYRILFWYLIFGSWHDKNSSRLLLPSGLLARMEGRSPNNTDANRFLSGLRDKVLPPDTEFRWTAWSKAGGKCRQLLKLDLGHFTSLLADEYRKRWHEGGRVFLDGSPFTMAKRRTLRLSEQEEASNEIGLCGDAARIQEYLNTLPSNQFSQIVTRNHAAAVEVAGAIQNPLVQAEQFRLLNAIAAQPQPFYRPSASGKTVRLFSRNSIQNLQRGVRRTITVGWHEADLQCAQLAIVARLWNAKDLTAFLSTGVNFWDYLLHEIKVAPQSRAAVKKCLKESVYSICFGMDEQYILGTTARRLARSGLETIAAHQFMRVGLVQSLLHVRTEALKNLSNEGGAMTPYGKWCPISADRHAREVMAELAQAWEMKLIAPLFELARSTSEFTVALYLFDGVAVNFNMRESGWKRRIKQLVDTNAREQGIFTELRWEDRGQGGVQAGGNTRTYSYYKSPKGVALCKSDEVLSEVQQATSI